MQHFQIEKVHKAFEYSRVLSCNSRIVSKCPFEQGMFIETNSSEGSPNISRL